MGRDAVADPAATVPSLDLSAGLSRIPHFPVSRHRFRCPLLLDARRRVVQCPHAGPQATAQAWRKETGLAQDVYIPYTHAEYLPRPEPSRRTAHGEREEMGSHWKRSLLHGHCH